MPTVLQVCRYTRWSKY